MFAVEMGKRIAVRAKLKCTDHEIVRFCSPDVGNCYNWLAASCHTNICSFVFFSANDD